LGIKDLDKFATSLRLRWPWQEWKNADKIWAGSGNPCSNEDMDIFYAATSITIGNGAKTPFWHAPWLDGRKPKDIAPLIFQISSHKKSKVAQAMKNNIWTSRIALGNNFTLEHLSQCAHLWGLLQNVDLQDDVEDNITWRLMANGDYSAKSAYDMQFMGAISSSIYETVWKAWAPPKVKFFAWLATQNRIWTADRLAKRGWPNCGACPLCKQTTESVHHLFTACRFTKRIWNLVKSWIGIPGIDTDLWGGTHIMDWWVGMRRNAIVCREAMASLTMLICWEIWNERNARIFRNKHASTEMVLQTIKREATMWVQAGAKRLGSLISRE
jgi:hypothetical protein